MTDSVDSASDNRTANNAVRHQYRVLSEDEKAQMVAIKDKGAEFLSLIDEVANNTSRIARDGEVISVPLIEMDGPGVRASRELALARTKIEEAVMWAVKHITA